MAAIGHRSHSCDVFEVQSDRHAVLMPILERNGRNTYGVP